jgi:RNA polymerase sigma factor (sigma-70 family)
VKLTNVQDFTGDRSLTLETNAVDPVAPRTEPPYRPISETLAIVPSVSVIIPARNEAANLAHVFATLPPWVDEVILVDGHSVDDTVAVTRALYPEAKVVEQPGKGKGDALQAGFAAATGEIIVMIDADGSTDGREMIRFVGALLAGADFAKGSRFSSSGGSDDITGVRRYGNWLLSFLVNRMFGTRFTDLCYGYNAFWARHLDVMELGSGPGFEVETLMNIRAAKAGLKIYEVPSYERPRIFGESNLRAVRDGWRILMVILREWLRSMRKRDPRRLTAEQAAAPVTSGVMAEIAARSYREHVYVSETSVDHTEMVAAIAANDVTGVSAAYDRYGEGLYTYCRSRLSQPADAADAVQNAFINASVKISELTQPSRLRAWLFAVARYECYLRLRDDVPSAQLHEAARATDDTAAFRPVAEPVASAEQAEYRALVRATLAGLDPVDREISELNLLHGFYGADLAAILGAPRDQARALAMRSRSRFERSLDVLLVARAGREHCHELAALLDGQGAHAILPLRRRIKRHIGHCQVCGERKRSGLNPGILGSLLPVIPPPTYLRERILALVCDNSPGAVAYRVYTADRAARFGADGFPIQLTTPSVPRSRFTPASVAAAAAVLALLGGAMYYVNNSSREVGHLVGVGRLPRLFAPPGSSGTTRPPASPQAAAPVPSPTPDLLPTTPGSTGSVPSLFFTLPITASSSGLLPLPLSSAKSSPPAKSSPSPKSSSPSSSSPSKPPSTPPTTSPPSTPPTTPPPSTPPSTPPTTPPSTPASSSVTSSAASSVPATGAV